MGQKGGKPALFPARKSVAGKSRWLRNFIANLMLLAFGVVMSISGLILQIHYHVGGHPDQSTVILWDRTAWNVAHTWAALVFLITVGYHIWAHRKWYGSAWKRMSSPKTRPTVILTFLMLLSAVSGIVPWLVSLFDEASPLRSVMVEVHDKVALLFLVILFLHTRRRLKWYAHVVRTEF